MKVRRKVLDAEAWRFNPEGKRLHEMNRNVQPEGTSGRSRTQPYWDWSVMGAVDTSMGVYLLEPGDWIVRDAAGTRPCSNEVFKQVYEEVF